MPCKTKCPCQVFNSTYPHDHQTSNFVKTYHHQAEEVLGPLREESSYTLIKLKDLDNLDGTKQQDWKGTLGHESKVWIKESRT